MPWLNDSLIITQVYNDTHDFCGDRRYFPMVVNFIDVMYDPFSPVYRHLGRDWFVSMEEAEFWWNLLIAPSTGQDSAMEEGLTI